MPPRLPIALTAQPRAIRVAQRAFSASFQRGESSRPPIPTPAKGTKAEKVDLAVQPLGRPLGVPKPPTSIPKTWTDKKNELLDEDRHKATRRALIKEASQGYFRDYSRASSASGGKLWIGPPVLIREDRALYFPDISGKSLLGTQTHTTDLLKGKITLLSITSTRISEEHIVSFTAPLLPDWLPCPSTPSSSSSFSNTTSASLFQHVQINHQANLLKSMLLSFFISSLKRTVPEEGWGRYLISGGEWSHYDIEGPLGLDNKLVGYVFLIDQNLKVRWAGCGPATEEEVESLRKGAAVLMKRASE
ncbi:ATPase assembly factor ATP10 [Dioszegia hungarica]|uniref:ATPase assembly factor ATP10 n=1 Tax=Dioszegia hungarica TaxID=4972 RepID=A0AA38HAH6_9TREE|nr:ATPase assembly factor ATP10 [Dioszegia hungarica]KAI9637255.1 ATPase assembly factor ATP10 [Dioszegia hungarica]